MTKVHYTERPQPVRTEPSNIDEKLLYTVSANSVEVSDGDWEADVAQFLEYPDNIDLADIEANPGKYLKYLPKWKYESTQREYTIAVQNWMDKEAGTRGYDGIQSACSYSNSTSPKFKIEGQACLEWRDKVWTACYEHLDRIMAGEEELKPIDEFIAALPQMQWPNW